MSINTDNLKSAYFSLQKKELEQRKTIKQMSERIKELETLVSKNESLHLVSKRKHQNTYDWGYINGYDDCNKGLPKRDDLGVYDN